MHHQPPLGNWRTKVARGQPRTSTRAQQQSELSEVAGDELVLQQQMEHAAPAFVWTSAWYPVAGLEDMDPSRPHAVTLLGKPLVLWRDGGGEWRAMDDACSHRLAPLSEGRVEPSTGRLQCAYHGFEFCGDGRCARVPQAESPAAEAAACASGRSHVASYPVTLAAGLLFVWPDSAPEAYVASAARPPPVPQGVDASLQRAGWYMRDLPYGHTVLLENLTDPAHLPFSHHGTSPGLRRSNGKAMPMQPDGAAVERVEAHGQLAMVMRHASVSRPEDGMELLTELSFRPPCYVRYVYDYSPDTKMTTEFYAVPTRPGESRVFLHYGAMSVPTAEQPDAGAIKKPVATSPPLLFKLMSMLPVWTRHMHSHQIFDGDGVFLRMQEQRLLQSGQSWRAAYWLPTSADRFVSTMRNWTDRVAAGGPAYAPGTSRKGETRQLTREQALDRYNQHTRHCKHCCQGVRQVTAARNAGLVLAALCAAAMLLLLARGAPAAGNYLVLAVVALVAAGIASKAHNMLPLFFHVDYQHADRH